MSINDKMAELQIRLCKALDIDPKDTLSLSLHLQPGNLLTADITKIVRLDNAAAVVQAIEDAGETVREAVR
jgi:SepF-like predicted cell division protein (DUF552 family)